MNERAFDVAVVGSGAGGGTVASELAPLVAAGARVVVLEAGPRFREAEMDTDEVAMARALYVDSGGFLTADGAMTLAFARAYGGSTVVYTGTSMFPPERVIRNWGVTGLLHSDLEPRARKHAQDDGVHYLEDREINENNRLFVEGCRRRGYDVRQFPVNVRGCEGSGLCNLGCAHGAKQGTHKVQLPRAEKAGVEVVTRATVERIEERLLHVRVSPAMPGDKGGEPEWAPGPYRVRARVVVLAGGAVGTPALMLRSGLGAALPALGRGFTCHPAQILLGEHPRPIGNDVGHPKSYYLDRAQEEGFVLETCMYFPFVTAKSLRGFGPAHQAVMQAFPRLQMILALACDKAVPDNRVAVDGAGRPVVHYRFTPEVRAALARASRTAARIFFAAGAARVHLPMAEPATIAAEDRESADDRIQARHFLPGTTPVSAAHLMGGCAMGGDAHGSVTDAWGRVHGRPWLRVADSSLFPDSLEINPYLTIMALADRVAEAVRADLPDLARARQDAQAGA